MSFVSGTWHERKIDERLKNGLILGVGALALAGVIALQRNLDKVTTRDPARELLFLPDRRVIHAFALGDDATGADILWLRGVFYIAANDVEEKQEAYYANLKTKATPATVGRRQVSFGEVDFRTDPRLTSIFFWNMNSSDAPQLLNLVERVTDLNPAFVTPYVYAATSLAMFYGRYGEARKILDKGIKNCPQSWEPLYTRGFLRLFYENDKAGAADDVRHAALLPRAPTIVIQLAAAMEVGAGNRDVAIDFLRSLREVTSDEVLKKKIDDMLNVYGKGVKVERSARANKVGNILDSLLNEF